MSVMQPTVFGVVLPTALNVITSAMRWACNFDGVDDRGQLAFRAIDPDGDNTFEFWSPAGLSNTQAIVSQCTSLVVAEREFTLFVNANSMALVFGGVLSSIASAAQGLLPSTKYGLTLTGNNFTLTLDGLGGSVVRSGTFTRGAAREPTAQTLIGCRGNGSGVFANFFQGLQYDTRINNTLWPMADRDQAIQLPSPSGLGSELITQSVLENPVIKGSQWTYLGGGRWQYVGDGTLNELRFINAADQPSQGYLEFEIESISGQISCTIGGLSRSLFNTAGIKRYYYTDKNEAGANSAAFNFRRPSTSVTSCIIKNISFKPLDSCNPLTLVNTTPDRWQEVIE